MENVYREDTIQCLQEINKTMESVVHNASYPMGNRDSSPGGKADHSPLSSTEVNNDEFLLTSIQGRGQ
jgi:hypothetical protein